MSATICSCSASVTPKTSSQISCLGRPIGDVLDLRAFGIDSASEFQQVATNQGANVLVELGGGDRITLLAVQEAQFHDNDFRTDLFV